MTDTGSSYSTIKGRQMRTPAKSSLPTSAFAKLEDKAEVRRDKKKKQNGTSETVLFQNICSEDNDQHFSC